MNFNNKIGFLKNQMVIYSASMRSKHFSKTMLNFSYDILIYTYHSEYILIWSNRECCHGNFQVTE